MSGERNELIEGIIGLAVCVLVAEFLYLVAFKPDLADSIVALAVILAIIVGFIFLFSVAIGGAVSDIYVGIRKILKRAKESAK